MQNVSSFFFELEGAIQTGLQLADRRRPKP
jgi:hypothetical protein